MLKISKIKLPGVSDPYEIVDAAARDMIASLSGGSYFLGVTTTNVGLDANKYNPEVSINSTTVRATNGNMVIYVTTGGDGTAEFVWSCHEYQYWQTNIFTAEGEKYSYTVVASPTQEIKDSAVFVNVSAETLIATQTTHISEPYADGADYIKIELIAGGSGQWVKFGDLSQLGDLAYKDGVALTTGTAFEIPIAYEASSSSVTASGATTDTVMGTDTTFKSTVPIVTLDTDSSSAIGRIQVATGITSASASFASKDQKTVLTSSATMNVKYHKVKNVGSVTGVARQQLATTSVTQCGSSTVTANKSTWAFQMGTGNDAQTLIISGGNGSDVTAATKGSATTVATGTVQTYSPSSPGDQVVSSVNYGVVSVLDKDTTTASDTNAKVAFADSINTSGTGATADVIGASATLSASVTPTTTYAKVSSMAPIITVNSLDSVTAVTSVGTLTAAAQTITPKSGDAYKKTIPNVTGVVVTPTD